MCGSNFLAITLNTRANFILPNSMLRLRKKPTATHSACTRHVLPFVESSGSLACSQKNPAMDLYCSKLYGGNNFTLYVLKSIWILYHVSFIPANEETGKILHLEHIFVVQNLDTSENRSFYIFFMALRPNKGHAFLIIEFSRSHTTTNHIR
jgi:hypothetical protein